MEQGLCRKFLPWNRNFTVVIGHNSDFKLDSDRIFGRNPIPTGSAHSITQKWRDPQQAKWLKRDYASTTKFSRYPIARLGYIICNCRTSRSAKQCEGKRFWFSQCKMKRDQRFTQTRSMDKRCQKYFSLTVNIIGARFMLSLENSDTPGGITVAQYISNGFSDPEKSFTVREVITLWPASIRLNLTIAAIFKLRLFTSDVSQAYHQSREPFSQKIYVRF